MKETEETPAPKRKPTIHRCLGCGYPIHPSEMYCGECSCEEETL